MKELANPLSALAFYGKCQLTCARPICMNRTKIRFINNKNNQLPSELNSVNVQVTLFSFVK